MALLSEQYLCGAVRQELAEFLAGFWDIIPRHCLSECQVDEKDLGMLISGIEDVDVADWRTHTTVPNASAEAQAMHAGARARRQRAAMSRSPAGVLTLGQRFPAPASGGGRL